MRTRTMVGCLVLLAVASVSARAEGAPGATGDDGSQEAEQLTIGQWVGWGSASGIFERTDSGVQTLFTAELQTLFGFSVSDSGVEGRFSLTSTGLYGNDRMAMSIFDSQGTVTQGRDVLGEFNIDSGAGGAIVGTRDRVEFQTEPMTISGTVAVDGLDPFDVDGDPISLSIGTNITELTCDQLLGDWEVGIELELFERGWTPTFDGEWWAVPEPEGPEESELQALIEDFPELLADAAEIRTDLRTGAFQDDPNAIGERMLSLAERAGEIANRLHNLTECDARAIGDETLQQWSNLLAGTVAEVIVVLYQTDWSFVPYEAVNALTRAADQTGAYGSGSSLDPAIAGAVETSLVNLTSQSIEQNLEQAQDDSNSAEARERYYLWALGAAVDAAGHGWTITVNGRSYPPGEAGELFETSPSPDAQEGSG